MYLALISGAKFKFTHQPSLKASISPGSMKVTESFSNHRKGSDNKCIVFPVQNAVERYQYCAKNAMKTSVNRK